MIYYVIVCMRIHMCFKSLRIFEKNVLKDLEMMPVESKHGAQWQWFLFNR